MKNWMRIVLTAVFVIVLGSGVVSVQAAEYDEDYGWYEDDWGFDDYNEYDYWISDCDVKLAKDSYAYTGKAIEPVVTVMDGSGAVVDPSKYTVKYKR